MNLTDFFIIFKHNKTGREGAQTPIPALTTQPNEVAVMADSKVSISTKEEKEIWKDIPGFDGWYQVSNKGCIKSYRVGGRYCQGLRSEGKILSPSPDKEGYPIAHLTKNGKSIFKKVHRLVAKAFIPNPENKREINHINGVKDDNNVSNLEWVTNSENQIHAVKNGFRPKSTKLTEEDVLEMRELYDAGEKEIMELTEMYPVSRTTVARAVKRKSWKWLRAECGNM